MMEGNYLINIRIWEASDLIPRGTNSYLNPYCVISLMNKFEKTKTCKKTLSPVWDKGFTYEFSNLKKQDLETAIITIEVFDEQYLVFSESVGKYEIDLTSVYYEQYHQFYRTWFTLVDAEDKKEGLMGYIMLSIDVLGPNDKPHVREKITEDSVAQTVVSKKIPQIGYLIIAELFRAEHLASMNMTKKTNDSFVKLNYGGATVSSSVVDDNNPTWNEVLYLQAMMPNHSKNLQIELWNKNSLMQDDLVGTCLIPFNSFHCIEDLPPTWVNIYGPPLCGIGEDAREMAEHGFMRGSSYRGRILMRLSSIQHDNPKSRAIKMVFKTPEMIIPNPPMKSYFFRIEIFSGQELPGNQGMLHFLIGPYYKKSTMVKSEFGRFDWKLECIEFNRIMLPIDASMIPDFIIYFADEDFESHRKCFFRMKPAQILCRTRKRYSKEFQRPSLIKFKEDQSLDLVPDDQFSGFVILRPVLFSYEPPERINPEFLEKKKVKYQLRLFFYVGRNLPTAMSGGSCNPLVVIRVANQIIYSRIKKNTINPEWYHVETTDIETYDSDQPDCPPLAVVVMLYHVDDPLANPADLFEEKSDTGLDIKFEFKEMPENYRKVLNALSPSKKVLLGRFWLELNMKEQKQYRNPNAKRE